MWSRHHFRHSHGVTTLQIFIPVITPLTLDLFNAIFSKLCNQMYLINIWNRVQLTCLPAGSLVVHQWTSRFAVKNKIGIKREQSIYFNSCVMRKMSDFTFFVFAATWGIRDGYGRFVVLTIIIYTPKERNGPFRFFCLFLFLFFLSLLIPSSSPPLLSITLLTPHYYQQLI